MVDITRAEIEHIRTVLTASGFTLTEYHIHPTVVGLTVKKTISGLTDIEVDIQRIQLNRLLETFKWNVTSMQHIGDDLIATAERSRQNAGII